MNDKLTKIEIGFIGELLAAVSVESFRQLLIKNALDAFTTSHKNTNIEFNFVKSKPDPEAIAFIKEREIILSDKTAGKLEGDLKYELLEGLKNNESIDQITRRLNKIFNDAMPWQLERIARSEIVTAQNAGRVSAYKNSGVVNYKMWIAAKGGNEKRVCDLCARMNGQIQPLDKPFVDPVTGGSWQYPIAHPNGRCTTVPLMRLPDNVITVGGQSYDSDKIVNKIEIYTELLKSQNKREAWVVGYANGHAIQCFEDEADADYFIETSKEKDAGWFDFGNKVYRELKPGWDINKKGTKITFIIDDENKKIGKLEINIASLNKNEKKIWIKATSKRKGHYRNIKGGKDIELTERLTSTIGDLPSDLLSLLKKQCEDDPKSIYIPPEYIQFTDIKEGLKEGNYVNAFGASQSNMMYDREKIATGFIIDKEEVSMALENPELIPKIKPWAWNIDAEGKVRDDYLGTEAASKKLYFGEILSDELSKKMMIKKSQDLKNLTKDRMSGPPGEERIKKEPTVPDWYRRSRSEHGVTISEDERLDLVASSMLGYSRGTHERNAVFDDWGSELGIGYDMAYRRISNAIRNGEKPGPQDEEIFSFVDKDMKLLEEVGKNFSDCIMNGWIKEGGLEAYKFDVSKSDDNSVEVKDRFGDEHKIALKGKEMILGDYTVDLFDATTLELTRTYRKKMGHNVPITLGDVDSRFNQDLPNLVSFYDRPKSEVQSDIQEVKDTISKSITSKKRGSKPKEQMLPINAKVVKTPVIDDTTDLNEKQQMFSKMIRKFVNNWYDGEPGSMASFSDRIFRYKSGMISDNDFQKPIIDIVTNISQEYAKKHGAARIYRGESNTDNRKALVNAIRDLPAGAKTIDIDTSGAISCWTEDMSTANFFSDQTGTFKKIESDIIGGNEISNMVISLPKKAYINDVIMHHAVTGSVETPEEEVTLMPSILNINLDGISLTVDGKKMTATEYKAMVGG